METAASIREYIRGQLLMDGEASLHDDTLLWGGLIDSVGLMQLVTFIEERFGIEIDDEELSSAQFGTVSDIAQLVDRKVAGA
jgi:acyl carrier protein